MAAVVAMALPPSAGAGVSVAVTYGDATHADQDDMALWVHPVDPGSSTVITSDKGNGNVYVYDLDGNVLQTVRSAKPGNIDIRYGFSLGRRCVDLVAFNDRGDRSIRVYEVDPVTRRLERVDDGNIETGDNYGFGLYRHPDGRLLAHTGPKDGTSVIKQYELFDDGAGRVTGQATGWEFDETTVEGIVGDDELGYIFLAEENRGIWRVDAMDDRDKTLIAAAGDASGLRTDVEGVTIYYAAGGEGYIIASSQRADKFTILERRPPHRPVGEFSIDGVGNTDGIDVLNLQLNGTFSQGIFTVHNGSSCCPVQAATWSDIANEVGGLVTDTDYWDPRASNRSCGAVGVTTTLAGRQPTATTTSTTVEESGSKTSTTSLPLPQGAATTTTTLPNRRTASADGCGDFDSDGFVSATDALGVANAAVGATTCEPAICDVTGDGSVTTADVVEVLQVVTGWRQELTCSKEPRAGGEGIWTSAAELASLPTSGAAWSSLKSVADTSAGTPDLSDQNDPVNVRVLAKALAYARTGQESYRREVIDACMAAMGTEHKGTSGGKMLPLARELSSYVIAADLVGLPSEQDTRFRDWLRKVRQTVLSGQSLITTHENRPNNWGTHAGASRLAVALYLGEREEVHRVAEIFRGWLGDRSAYTGFSFGDLSWQADPSRPIGINPRGATKQGHNIDGVVPDDQRRGGGFTWPPFKENYAYEALQGAVAQAVMLHRAGYDVWNWQDKALLRAFRWLHEQADFPAQDEDTWQPHLINHYYGTSLPAPVPTTPGKAMGWTDWTHAGVVSSRPTPATTTTTVKRSQATTTTTTTTSAGTNRPPQAAITSPPDGQAFDEGDTVEIRVEASDPDGSIASVQLFAGGARIDQDASAPFRFTISDIAQGTYTLTVKAIDDEGAVTSSRKVTIEVSGAAKGPGAPSEGIWASAAELKSLPTSGAAWSSLKSAADKSAGTPDLSDQNDPVNVRVLAKALVYARTGQESYRREVIDACMAAIGTEHKGTSGGKMLPLARELSTYVIAADLVGLPSEQDARFRDWLRQVRKTELSGKSLITTHEERPNNWGTHAGASRLAVALYLGESSEVARVAQVFKGWLGDRSAYTGFSFGDLSWQADPSKPVGINPRGATKQGHNIDGVVPDDQRRGGGFTWPPFKENYAYEGLQGAVTQAVMLHRAGYDVWNWQDKALLRAFRWLHEQAKFPAQGEDTWQPHLVNYYYGTSLPAPVPTTPGKAMGWTDWTHAAR